MSEKIHFEESSGNVFADLGLAEADELLVKSDLMHVINQEIKRRGLSRHQAAALANITQPDVSRIARGKMDAFSQERLIDILRQGFNWYIHSTMKHYMRSKGTQPIRLRRPLTVDLLNLLLASLDLSDYDTRVYATMLVYIVCSGLVKHVTCL